MMTGQRLRKAAGFTIVEILIVIVIIGILAAIAMPMYLGSRTRAKDAEARTGARAVAIAVMTYVIDTEDNPPLPVEDCTKDFLVAHGAISAEEWPNNAFFPDDPMQLSPDRLGDFNYWLADTPQQFGMAVHLSDGPWVVH